MSSSSSSITNTNTNKTQWLQLAASCLIFAFACWNFASVRQSLPQQRNLSSSASSKNPDRPSPLSSSTQIPTLSFRILYIVTTLREYETGQRSTRQGADRFTETLLPVLRESAWSLKQVASHVDLVLITHYNVTIRHQDLLRKALEMTPTFMDTDKKDMATSIPFEIWPEATPLAYGTAYGFIKPSKKTERIGKYLEPHFAGLSRQHRFVIKDRWQHYDFFVVMEDDMLVHGEHVQQYWKVTQQLYQLRLQAESNNKEDHKPIDTETHRVDRGISPSIRFGASVRRNNKIIAYDYYGGMTKGMLQRTVPGLFRVEAVLRGWNGTKDQHFEKNMHVQVPIDYQWWRSETPSSHTTNTRLDPSICCHVWNVTTNSHIPQSPKITDLHFWETSLDALGIRLMPDGNVLGSNTDDSNNDKLGWCLLQVGGLDGMFGSGDHPIPDYWVGLTEGGSKEKPIKYFVDRPDTLKGRYSSNQGGWFATKRQILEWHTQNCDHGFLPPFPNERIAGERQPRRRDRLFAAWDVFDSDGLGLHSVEYYSGGQQLFGPVGCNLRRIIPLEPSQFSRHLIYHSSNNKQRQQNVAHRFSSHNIAEFWGQLNTVRKQAEQRMIQHETKRSRKA